MTYEETLFQLQCWERAVRPCYESANRMIDLFDGQYDCPALQPFQNLIEEYTKLVGKQVNDQCGFLEYYQYECDWGNKPLEVTMTDGEKILLDSLPKLAKIICTP